MQPHRGTDSLHHATLIRVSAATRFKQTSYDNRAKRDRMPNAFARRKSFVARGVAQKTAPKILLPGMRRNMPKNPAFSSFQTLTLPIFRL
jgi:hypothetical protein